MLYAIGYIILRCICLVGVTWPNTNNNDDGHRTASEIQKYSNLYYKCSTMRMYRTYKDYATMVFKYYFLIKILFEAGIESMTVA